MTTAARQQAQPAPLARQQRATGSATGASQRRSHTRERVIDAAIEVLDAGGIDALTFRALAGHLSTGAGAIYHHVRDKDDLLAAAASRVLMQTLGQLGPNSAGVPAGAGVVAEPTPAPDKGEQGRAVREVVLAAYDAVVARPWLGAQLAAAPWQPAVLQLLEAVGCHLDALEVPTHLQLDAASLLVQHVLGVASQRAAAARLTREGTLHDRGDFLAGATSTLTSAAHGGETRQPYPFLRRVAEQLRGHDDREQFLTGVHIILRGTTTA